MNPRSYQALEPASEVQTAPIMPALDRYTGTLYDGLHGRGLKGTPTEFASLGDFERERAKDTLLIQSALFGLIPATDLIPNYRLSGTTVFPASYTAGKALPGGLKGVWSKAHPAIFARLANCPLIDLRSKSYADLAPIPAEIQHHWVEVVSRESNGELRALNHFNKLAKGLLIRAVLQAAKAPESIDELSLIAESIGMELSLDPATQNLVLVTDQIVKAKRATAN